MKTIGYLLSLLLGTATVCSAQAPTPTPCGPCLEIPAVSCAVVPPTPAPSATPYTYEAGISPTPWPTPAGQPQFTPIPTDFQPHRGDGTLINESLGWRVYSPGGSGPWPVIVVIPGGGFHDPSKNAFSTGNGILDAATALQAKGYYVLVVAYRLAREGVIPGQTRHPDSATADMGADSGIYPYQEHDVESLIRAARADPHCLNGLVGVIGGSGGATHAIYAALDTSVKRKWPYWNFNRDTQQPANDRPNAAAGLSGAYNFADRTDTGYDTGQGCINPIDEFARQIENYTRRVDYQGQRAASTVALLDNYNVMQNGIVPLLLINARRDPMPYHQLELIDCSLTAAGWVKPSDYQTMVVTVDGNDQYSCQRHAFGYWHAVKDEVIAFFNCRLKGQCAGSGASP